MLKLKLSCFISVAIFLFFKSAKCEFMCNEYRQVGEARSFFTIAGENLSTKNYTEIIRNVSCPCSAARPCLRKCCLQNYIYEYINSTRKCTHFNKTEASFKNLPNISTDNYTLIYGFQCLTKEKSLETLKVLKDGSLELQHRHLPLNKYCIEYFEHKKDFRLLECEESIPETEVGVRKIFQIICLGFSIICLIATLVVYFCNKELRNGPGKILLCHVTSFLTTEVCLAAMQFISVSPGIVCKMAAYLLQFSFSATFFWLNVMCFDLWSAFRRRTFRIHKVRKNNNKFNLYSWYAWGMPLIILTVVITLDHITISEYFVKPEIGQERCWFKTNEARFWYFYSYTSILLLLNLCMFSTTLINLLNERKNRVKFFKNNENKRFNARETRRFFLYLKLYLIMGINWTLEALSYYMRDITSLTNFWLFTDSTNLLQGFFIFLIFVCNGKVILLLDEKFRKPSERSEVEVCTITGSVKSNC